MDGLREKLNNADIELKIAAFCAVIMVLSIIYKMVDPILGDIVNDIAIATFCMSLAIFIYKFIFGNINFGIILMFSSWYVSALGKIFQENPIFYGGIVFSLLIVAVSAFKWIFFKKKTTGETEESNNSSEDV